MARCRASATGVPGRDRRRSAARAHRRSPPHAQCSGTLRGSADVSRHLEQAPASRGTVACSGTVRSLVYIRWTSLTGSSTAGGPIMVFARRQRLALTAHGASCLPDDAVPIVDRQLEHQRNNSMVCEPSTVPTTWKPQRSHRRRAGLSGSTLRLSASWRCSRSNSQDLWIGVLGDLLIAF